MSDRTLAEEFAALPEEKAEELAQQIREQFAGTRYVELVQWVMKRIEDMTVAQIKGYGGGDNERLWNAVGRIQAVEMVRGFLFPVVIDEPVDEKENQ